MKDLSKLASLTGISEFLFRRALGIRLEPCAATTADEARKVSRNQLVGREARYAAHERWIELSLIEVKAAASFEEVREVYDFAPANSDVRAGGDSEVDGTLHDRR